MDFLSAQALWPGEAGIPAVVMNSVAMAAQAADYVAVTGAVPMAFLDNDEAGERGLATLASVCSRPVSDERGRYAGSKDVNGYLVSLAQADTAGIRAQIRD